VSNGSTQLAHAEVAPADRLVTLPPWPWDLVDPTAPRTLGWHAIAWAEGGKGFPNIPPGWPGLIQPNGPRSGRPLQLTPDQQTFLLWWYALGDDGHWIYHHGARRLAKGSGKSPFAAIMALIEFLAPVRLARFDDGAPGGCVARPVDMPLVQIAATAESQTANTMRMVRAFAPKRGHVVEFYDIDWGKTVFYRVPEGTLQVITSSASAAEGAEASFIVADETEHWRPSNGGVELSETLWDNLAKSGARMLETSNAWVPGMGTVAELTWDAWVAQEEGRVQDGAILYDARIAPPDCDMSDRASLTAALHHVYADCAWKIPEGEDVPDVAPILKRIWSPAAKPAESARKYLNRPTVSDEAWADPADWSQMVDTDRVVADAEPIVMFFDGSKSKDATALVGCCVSDGHIFRIGVWEPSKDEEVNVHAVDLAVRQARDRWTVQGFFADVREWESFTKVSWPELFPDLLVKAVPSGKMPQPIAWDMRTHTYEFTTEAELTATEIEGHEFTHCGDSAVARHVANATLTPNRYGTSVSKESPDSPKKIDAAVCVIGARMVRRRLLAAPRKKTKQPGRVRGRGRR